MKQLEIEPEFLKLYHLIPKDKKRQLVTILGYKTCSGFISKYKITDKEMELLQKFVGPYVDNSLSNTILNYVPFDKEQVLKHYNALTKLISTAAFQHNKPHEKDRLIDYQLDISRQLMRLETY